MFKFSKFWAFSLILAGGLLCFNNLSWAKSSHQKLSSMPEGSYQLARSVFLPNAGDDVWLSNYNKLPSINSDGKYTDMCSKQGYILKSCPSNGKCTTCPMDNSYKKLVSCASGYKVSSSKTYCEKVCPVEFCNTSEYFMTTCPEGTVCETCTAVLANCSETKHYKPTTNCLSGYCYMGGRCQKTQEKSCGFSYGSNPEWPDKCPTGYICTQNGTYMTSDCKTGPCWRYSSCDNAKNYYLSTSSPTPICKHMPCYKTQTTCSGYPLDSPPNNARYSSCTITNKYCEESGTKYKIDSCNAGYHLKGNACEKDCTPGSELSTLVVYDPIFKTNTECLAQDGVQSCMYTRFYTTTDCIAGNRYFTKSCKTGYSLKSYKSGNTITIACAKNCVVNQMVLGSSDDVYASSNFYSSSATCRAVEGVNACVSMDFYTSTSCEKKSHYIIASCKTGYTRTLETINGEKYISCKPTSSCKNVLIANGGSINTNNVLVSSQDELEKAIENIASEIIIADDFKIEGTIALISGKTLKGIREILEDGQYEKACPKPTLTVEGSEFYSSTTFTGVDFNLGAPRSGNYGYAGIFGGGNFENCNFKWGDSTNPEAKNYLHMAMTRNSKFNNCTMSGINLTLSAMDGYTRTYNFNDIEFDGGSITPVGSGIVQLMASGNTKLQNGARFGGWDTMTKPESEDKFNSAYGFNFTPGKELIFDIYGPLTIKSPYLKGAFHNTERKYTSQGSDFLAKTTVNFGEIIFEDTQYLVLSYPLDKNLQHLTGTKIYSYNIKSSTTLPVNLIGHNMYNSGTVIKGDPYEITTVNTSK